jgi:hypothetical protein
MLRSKKSVSSLKPLKLNSPRNFKKKIVHPEMNFYLDDKTPRERYEDKSVIEKLKNAKKKRNMQ